MECILCIRTYSYRTLNFYLNLKYRIHFFFLNRTLVFHRNARTYSYSKKCDSESTTADTFI